MLSRAPILTEVRFISGQPFLLFSLPSLAIYPLAVCASAYQLPTCSQGNAHSLDSSGTVATTALTLLMSITLACLFATLSLGPEGNTVALVARLSGQTRHWSIES